MKGFLRNLVLFLLKKMAMRKFKKFKGKVVAITGSVGKTSTKDAIYTVLNSQFKVKASRKSMNTEFGLLLTILDIESGYNSAIKWGWLLLVAFWHMFAKDYNEILLLEMGVDKPKDMDFLVSVARPDIAIFTGVSPVHLDKGQFKNLEEVFDEKLKMVKALKKDGIAILNTDDERVAEFAGSKEARALKKEIAGEMVSYGRGQESDFRATRVTSSLEGLQFMVTGDKIKGSDQRMKMEANSSVVGEQHVYAMLPAIIAGLRLGMEPEVILEALSRFKLPPGRMTVIPANVEGAMILDSSYNSSPMALHAALETLDKVSGEKNRRVAVLGNMNELGELSDEMHKGIGGIIGKYCDFLITVGAKARLIGEVAVEKGALDAKTSYSFGRAEDAAEFFAGVMKKGDVILVKGSQNRVRLERFVKAIMAHPEDAEKMLCRQEKPWV